MELSLPDLPDVFWSRTDGYCFQPAVGITYVVVRHLLHSHLSFMESRDTPQDVNVLHSPVPLLLEYLYSRVTHSDFVGIGRVVCIFVGVRLDHLGIQRQMGGVAGWPSSSFTHFSCAASFTSLTPP